eukprot:gene4060-21330_t
MFIASCSQQSTMTEDSRLALHLGENPVMMWRRTRRLSGEVEVRMRFNEGVALALVTPSQEQGTPGSRLDRRRSSAQTASTVPADPWWASPARRSNVRVQVCFDDTPDVALVTPSQDHMDRPIPLLQKAILWAAPAARPRPPSTCVSDHSCAVGAPRPSVGDRVRLAPEVVAEQEAGQGCLRVGRGEEGVVVRDEGDDQPFLVRGPRGGEFWYRGHEEVRGSVFHGTASAR